MHSLNSENKYLTDIWLTSLQENHPILMNGIRYLRQAICLADDIADRQRSPDYTVAVLWQVILGAAELKIAGHFESIFNILKKIHDAEVINLDFVPGQFPVEHELELWSLRSSTLDLYFETLCCVYPDIRTEANEQWFERFKRYSLIHNDCMDILTSAFEDLNRLRRNYVILYHFGADGYFQWQSKIDQFKEVAQAVLDQLTLDEPEDDRLKPFMKNGDSDV